MEIAPGLLPSAIIITVQEQITSTVVVKTEGPCINAMHWKGHSMTSENLKHFTVKKEAVLAEKKSVETT